MADDKTPTLKDAVVIIPLFASSLAIAWEVGRFLPFDGFLQFSFSEHLLSAMEALPFALIVTVACAAMFFLFHIPNVLAAAAQQPEGQAMIAAFYKRMPKSKIAKALIAVALVIVFIALNAWFAYFSFNSTAWANVRLTKYVLMMFALLVILNLTFFHQPWAGPVLLPLFAAIAIMLALTMSQDISKLMIRKYKQGRIRPAEITLKSGTVQGHVIMSGEHGILIYLPDIDSTVFERSDDLQRIEWRRKRSSP
ncbi:hypothetical protein V5279_23215 [Bradyrhizobium sp. 26S5]|uniref:hypothetical protein n=1 Tax=Bradyrhizobium sp. 26S5 TaxID=3139729 RepID=UPI0030D1720A